MKQRTITISTAAVSCLIACGTASADFQSLSWDMFQTAWGDTYRLYVDIDTGGEVDAVFGDPLDAMFIETNSGSSFYQNMFGGPTSMDINASLFGFFPSLEFDSFVTIGRLTNTSNALLNIGFDWSTFEAGGSMSTSNGSWFATTMDDQVHDQGDGRILIGQFTVEVGEGIHGIINMQGKNADGSMWISRNQAFNTSIVPAPGALALLGAAGLAFRRRRT